ncbi:hypothetical protein JS532_04725 [Bifidobacterium callimiconis]|uniref:hypothetical protein n=1 Tax=Bifidobacterium callimiconis TaxID=2306973 RepID=UPI001BDD2770|nr:hypothetical protein [Bifidobacterium callimiconis]MBT1176874.1 hypothetical protein [Bifidobacterium callimiconis]
MSESSKHENKCEIIRALNFVERWSGTIGIVIALGSLVAAIYAVILPFQQWQQDIADKQEDAVQEQKDRKAAEEKWREEGAMFSLAYITNRDQQLSDTDLETGVTSVQSNHAMVITNSGRTQGTIIAIRQTDSPDNQEIVCTPSVSNSGNLALLPNTGEHAYSLTPQNVTDGMNILGTSEIRLAPGESQVIILAGKKYPSGTSIAPYRGKYTLYEADGTTTSIQPEQKNDTYNKHYVALLEKSDAQIACGANADRILSGS